MDEASKQRVERQQHSKGYLALVQRLPARLRPRVNHVQMVKRINDWSGEEPGTTCLGRKRHHFDTTLVHLRPMG